MGENHLKIIIALCWVIGAQAFFTCVIVTELNRGQEPFIHIVTEKSDG